MNRLKTILTVSSIALVSFPSASLHAGEPKIVELLFVQSARSVAYSTAASESAAAKSQEAASSAAAASAQQSAAAASASGPAQTPQQKLESLKSLYDQGLISKSDYEAAKSKILGQITQ